ncbi:hypothetical protein KM043_006814 [Ampulex compressa]|nr:hypothetical protein KM043_006814 [Ampulex compressa]
MSFSETIHLNEKKLSASYVHDTCRFYSRQREEQLQMRCIDYTIVLAIFTMAVVVTISYSVSHDTIDRHQNLSRPEGNTTGPLRLGLAPESGSYTIFSNTDDLSEPRGVLFARRAKGPAAAPSLSEKEVEEGLKAGQRAINDRLSADTIALASPVPNPSPEFRHRYAMSTCTKVGPLALVAVAEIAATKRIEKSRMQAGEPSSMGSYFDGGWTPTNACKAHLTVNCTVGKYRTLDGSCNRPMQWGASMRPFRRVLPADYANGIDAPRRARSGKELPSAREISLKVHKPSPSSNPAFTVMLAVFGQFLDHDITATAISQGVNGSSISCCPASVDHPECFPVRVGPGDPVYDVAGRKCMEFVRSAPAPQCKLGPREQLNQVSAFIDGSMIYGLDVGMMRELREFRGGRLRMQRTPDDRQLLPRSTNPNDGCNRETERVRGRYCFAAGDARANENLHLTTMHLLWARQHNRIADELARINPAWKDERIYQEARRIIGAQLQHVAYQEFLPIVLGDQEVESLGLKPLKSGFREPYHSPDDTNDNPTVANHFVAAAFRFAHTLLPGLMRMTDAQKGTSSYIELHRMLFNPYSLYAENGVETSILSATDNVVQMTSTHVTSQLTNHLFEDPMGNTTVPCGLDLVSLNIQRGRDHGLPGYTKWREHCGLGKAEGFSDLEGHFDPEALQQISALYESVDDIDLYTGALAELPKSGGIVGPTFTCLIADQFDRLQKGDRFWYEVPDQVHSFTDGQLRELRKTSLAKLICDCSDGITKIQAEAMRSVGPANPMMSCEDLPGPSYLSWKDDVSGNEALESSLPNDWPSLKRNISGTIREIAMFINDTGNTASSGYTDWLTFREYVSNTFFALRDQFDSSRASRVFGRYPKLRKSWSTMDDAGFTSRSTSLRNVFYDWESFKSNTLTTLRKSTRNIVPDLSDVSKWTAFKENLTSEFADLRYWIDIARSVDKYRAKQSVAGNANRAPVENFDWKRLQRKIVCLLDNAIIDLATNSSTSNGTYCAPLGPEMKLRYNELRNRIMRKGFSASKGHEVSSNDVRRDWLSLKTNIVQTVNDVVEDMANGMSDMDGLSWSRYRDDIMKDLSAFKMKVSLSNDTFNSDRSEYASGNKNIELTNLITDWLIFRKEINDTLIEILQRGDSSPIASLGWIMFNDTMMDNFALLKNKIAQAKSDWREKVSGVRLRDDEIRLGNFSTKSKYTPYSDARKASDFSKQDLPVPVAEWVDFKKEINSTVMRFQQAANNEIEISLVEIQDQFEKSFADIKKDLVSLRNLTSTNDNAISEENIWSRFSAKWTEFRAEFNSTTNDLVESLKNESKPSIEEITKVLFRSRDRLAAREPRARSNLPGSILYLSQINDTLDEALKSIIDIKHSMIVRVTEPIPSRSASLQDIETLWISSLVPTLNFFLATSKFYA